MRTSFELYENLLFFCTDTVNQGAANFGIDGNVNEVGLARLDRSAHLTRDFAGVHNSRKTHTVPFGETFEIYPGNMQTRQTFLLQKQPKGFQNGVLFVVKYDKCHGS